MIGKRFKNCCFGLIPMSEAPLNVLFQKVTNDVALLPAEAVQLVEAVIEKQYDLPLALSAFLMDKLALQTDMSVVSPAAEALIRMRAFVAYSDIEFAQLEIETRRALLKAIALNGRQCQNT